MTDSRWHFGGPYGYEFDCQIIPPVGSGLSSRLESQASVFLGQLESYRRLSNLQTITQYGQDSSGNLYEYGFRMGRPYAIIKMAKEPQPPQPFVGRSGIVFYHEAIRSAHLYKQGVVARDSGSKPSEYVMVDAPWNGYASKNKRTFLGGDVVEIDERMMFKPHSVAWSVAFQVHVVVQRQINADDALSRIFIGGFSALQSDVVDFVGANLYQDKLAFAYIDPSQNLVFSSIPLAAISYDAVFAYDAGNDSPKTEIPDAVGNEETICNYHPSANRAAFISAFQSSSGSTYSIDYVIGEFSGGVVTVEDTQTGVIIRDTVSVTTSPHITSVVRTAVYYVDSGESYQGTTALPPHRVTDDFSFSCTVPDTEHRIDLDMFPIWTGYNEAGVRTNWRLSGFSSTSISGTIARDRHYDSDAADNETYSASVPTIVHSTEIDLGIYHVTAGSETLSESYAVERTNWTTSQDPSEISIGDNFVTAHAAIAGDKFVLIKLSGTVEESASISVPMGTASTTNSLGGTGSFSPSSGSSTSGTMTVPLISADSSNGYPAVDYSFRKYNAYQDILENGLLSVESQGSNVLDIRPIGDNALYSYAGPELAGMRDGLGPDPYTGGEAFGPITVTRTVTYSVESNPSISANVRNNIFISNYLGRGCLYDFRMKKHVISPWGIYSSDVIHAYGGETKKVYCADSSSSIEITPDFLTAEQDSDSTAQMPIPQIGNVFVDDFFDPRGLL